MIQTNEFSMEISGDSLISSSFGLLGSDMTTSGSTFDTAPTAAETQEPFYSGDGSITIDGSSTDAVVTSASLTIANNIEQLYQIGSNVPFCQQSLMVDVSGECTIYFTSNAMMNKFIAEAESNIVLVAGNGSDSYTFRIPRAKWNTATMTIDNSASAVTMQYTALYDTTTATSVEISKS